MRTFFLAKSKVNGQVELRSTEEKAPEVGEVVSIRWQVEHLFDKEDHEIIEAMLLKDQLHLWFLESFTKTVSRIALARKVEIA
jgi:hypothetical protein